MKWSFLLFSSIICLQAFAQYPATGNKARLGWQTTGDGLVYRGAIGDTTTLDPSGINNAWMLLDTASGNLYAYRTKAWRLVSGGGGGGGLTMPFDSVTFNVNETDASLRELKYSEEKGYLQYGGQDSVQIPILPGIWYVRNDTSVTIPKGTVLRATGTLGASGRIKVKHMIANGSIDAMYILGIAMHDIAVGADGYAMSQGKIRQVNTQAYSEGSVLYADVDTLGGLTQTEPGNGFLKLPIAFVVHSASNGVLAVRVTPGAYMRDLHDVEITSPTTNASLYYNTAQGIWRDTGAAVLVADTSVMLSPYLKKADTTSLSNRINLKLNISDTSVFARDFQISGTSGQVAYFNAANAVTSDTAFRWSAANKTLGINTSTTSGANIIIKNSQEPSRSTVVATQTFAADTTNWTRGTGWTFNGTQAVATAATGALTYTPALTITSGNAYEVTYTISGYSAGTLTAAVGNVTYPLPTHNATGNVVVLLPTSATGGFRFTTSTFTGNLDNVSVVQIASPAPVLLAGQDDNSTTLYSSLVIPNSTSFAFGGGGVYITGNNNTANGYQALRSNTTGTDNTANGYQALRSNTTGSSNTAIGRQALYSNTTGSSNTANGFYTLYSNTTGVENAAIGFRSLFFNTTGISNTAIGFYTLYSNTTGGNNTAIGRDALYSNTTGGNNMANGQQALYSNTIGSFNAANGYRVLYSNTTGEYNMGNGFQALYSNTTGNSNMANGQQALYSNTIGSFNAADGYRALYSNTTGSGNVAIGANAMYNTITADTLTGSNNVAIGRNAADNIRAAAAGNVAIGNQVDLPTSNGSNQGVYQNVLFFTGASGTGTTIAAGSRAGIKTNAPASDFHVAGEVRIDDLKPTGTPRNIVGSSSTGDLSTMAWGNGLTVSVGDTILRVDTSVILPKVNVSGTTNYLAKFTGSNAVGNSGVFESGGNVGIGTASPDEKLHINGSLMIERASDTLGSGGIFFKRPGTSSYNWLIRQGAYPGTNDDLFIDRNIGGTWYTGIAIDRENLNVGIATASPSRPLHVAGTTAIRIPVGNFAERGTSGAGDIRVRSDTANLEFHNGTTWQTVATQSYVTDNAISTVYIPINLYAPGDTVANTTTSKAFFMVHSGLNGYCIDSYTVKAISGSGTADIQIDKNGSGANAQSISGTTVATKDTNIALATGDYIRGQVFNLSGTLVGLGLTLEIKKTCN